MKTIIVNLKERTDRWAKVTQEVTRFGITKFERFNAVKKKCFHGVNHSMHKAINRPDDMFLLLEDDCYFEGTIEDLNKAISELPEDWDLLYLGGTLYETAKKHSDHLCRPVGVHTTHAVLYSKKGAKYCHDNFDPDGFYIYDDWLYRIANSALNIFIMSPMIAFQSPSYSDIWKKDADYDIKATSKFLEQ